MKIYINPLTQATGRLGTSDDPLGVTEYNTAIATLNNQISEVVVKVNTPAQFEDAAGFAIVPIIQHPNANGGNGLYFHSESRDDFATIPFYRDLRGVTWTQQSGDVWYTDLGTTNNRHKDICVAEVATWPDGLKWYENKPGVSIAATVAALQATAGTFFCDKTAIPGRLYVHTVNGGNPTGLDLVCTWNSEYLGTIGNLSGAGIFMGSGTTVIQNYHMKGIAVCGVMANSATAGTNLAACGVAGGLGGQSVLERILIKGGSSHSMTLTGNTTTSTTHLDSIDCEEMHPLGFATFAITPSASGGKVFLNNFQTDKLLLTYRSLTGQTPANSCAFLAHNSTGQLERLEISHSNVPLYTFQFNDQMAQTIKVRTSKILGGSTGLNSALTGNGAEWEDVWFTQQPPLPEKDTDKNDILHCYIQYKRLAFATATIQGTYKIRNSIFDASGGNSNADAGRCLSSAGALTTNKLQLTCTGNIIILKQPAPRVSQWFIYQIRADEFAVPMANNRWYYNGSQSLAIQQFDADSSGSGTIGVSCNNPGDFGLASLNSLGHYVGSSVGDPKISPTGYPAADAPAAILAGTIGAHSLNPTPIRRRMGEEI